MIFLAPKSTVKTQQIYKTLIPIHVLVHVCRPFSATPEYVTFSGNFAGV